MLTMLLIAGLVASPAMAYGHVSEQHAGSDHAAVADDRDSDGDGRPLLTAATEVAKEVAEETARENVAEPAVAVQQQGAPKWKTIVGLALIGTGVGVIAKGVSVWQDEPDRFDRTKNSDAYLAFGVGGTFVTFGTLMTIRGLKGEGFAH